MKKALSIGGSDCSGGAGIQADLKTFSAHGVFGMTVIASVVAENTCRVIEFQDVRPDIIEKQIEAVFEDIPPDAVKVGMLSCREGMEAVAGKLREWQARNVVVDPVMYAKNGCALMESDAIDTLIAEVVPLADVLTPNIPEAEEIAGINILTRDDMIRAAHLIHEMGSRAVLVKGGHSEGDATDVLFDGKEIHLFTSPRIATKNTHGTGCTLSSAIAANLANGRSVIEAVELAKDYITAAIEHALPIGHGHGPTNHFYNFFKNGEPEI
ncbi:MAG: bifunctional hydroxymethylpyrimidine kinase/phosphomethylpyrimidine kinase [Fastidiosipilaceae bacterium]|jgi:hydroxymethylpyrimidine/phosphomethylpyrimidine kinase